MFPIMCLAEMPLKSLKVEINFELWLSANETFRFFIFFDKFVILSEEWHFINLKSFKDL